MYTLVTYCQAFFVLTPVIVFHCLLNMRPVGLLQPRLHLQASSCVRSDTLMKSSVRVPDTPPSFIEKFSVTSVQELGVAQYG